MVGEFNLPVVHDGYSCVTVVRRFLTIRAFRFHSSSLFSAYSTTTMRVMIARRNMSAFTASPFVDGRPSKALGSLLGCVELSYRDVWWCAYANRVGIEPTPVRFGVSLANLRTCLSSIDTPSCTIFCTSLYHLTLNVFSNVNSVPFFLRYPKCLILW